VTGGWRAAVVWGLGFIAGVAIGVYVCLSSGLAGAQSAEVTEAIHQAAVDHGVSERWLLRVAWCESQYDPTVLSYGGHQGLFQFSPTTWRWMSAQAGYAGASPFDPWAAAQVTAWAFARGYSRHWSCA
jgi:soluble lytic murein transglycosylase-like protein